MLSVLGKSDCPARYEKLLNKTTLKKWTRNDWKLFPRNAVTQSPRKVIKQKVEHGIPCYIEDSKKAVDLHRSKGLCNNYLEGGWKIRGGGGGGHRKK